MVRHSEGFGSVRARAASAAFAAFAAAAIVAASGAGAVVGGAPDAGPLSRATAMVLSGRGGLCSAVVIGPDTLLTAGHCAAGGGEHRVHYKGPDGAPVLLTPAAVAVHPGYVRDAVATRRRSIDLAMIKLSEPLPAAFGAAALSAAVPARGAALTLGGFGLAQEGDPRSTGTFRVAALAAVEPHGPGKVLLWASDPRGAGSGACHGDSGGPIATGDGAVAAIASWSTGSGAGRCGALSQGVLLGPQRAWIDRTLAGWGRTATWR